LQIKQKEKILNCKSNVQKSEGTKGMAEIAGYNKHVSLVEF
jgi:hypothetical protein